LSEGANARGGIRPPFFGARIFAPTGCSASGHPPMHCYELSYVVKKDSPWGTSVLGGGLYEGRLSKGDK